MLGTIKDPQGSSIEELSFVGFFLLIDRVCVYTCVLFFLAFLRVSFLLLLLLLEVEIQTFRFFFFFLFL